MNIAEIRKKARAGKSQATQAPVEADAATSTAGETLLGGPVARPAPPAGTLSPGQPSPPAAVIATPIAGEDRLAQLFSWTPERDETLVESYGLEKELVETTARRWLAFTLGSEDYALEIGVIREIIKPREITEIPRVPGYLLGIISLRGNIIPIFDLKQRLRLGGASIAGGTRIIICQDRERLAGLLIDEITQVATIPEERIEPPPAIFSGVDRAMIAGVGRVQEKMLILLNLANVLNIELDVL